MVSSGKLVSKKPNDEALQTHDVLKFTVQKPISQFTILIHVNFTNPNSGFLFFYIPTIVKILARSRESLYCGVASGHTFFAL